MSVQVAFDDNPPAPATDDREGVNATSDHCEHRRDDQKPNEPGLHCVRPRLSAVRRSVSVRLAIGHVLRGESYACAGVSEGRCTGRAAEVDAAVMCGVVEVEQAVEALGGVGPAGFYLGDQVDGLLVVLLARSAADGAPHAAAEAAMPVSEADSDRRVARKRFVGTVRQHDEHGLAAGPCHTTAPRGSHKQRAHRVVNTELLTLYWTIGKAILDQQMAEGWGTRVIDRLADDLR